MYQVNNSVTFSRKPIGSEGFLNRMVGVLGIIIDRFLKEDLVKRKAKLLNRSIQNFSEYLH